MKQFPLFTVALLFGFSQQQKPQKSTTNKLGLRVGFQKFFFYNVSLLTHIQTFALSNLQPQLAKSI
ncbi:MAG: hypothetical protein ACPGU4_08080 [Flavobacteriales bacterium]